MSPFLHKLCINPLSNELGSSEHFMNNFTFWFITLNSYTNVKSILFSNLIVLLHAWPGDMLKLFLTIMIYVWMLVTQLLVVWPIDSKRLEFSLESYKYSRCFDSLVHQLYFHKVKTSVVRLIAEKRRKLLLREICAIHLHRQARVLTILDHRVHILPDQLIRRMFIHLVLSHLHLVVLLGHMVTLHTITVADCIWICDCMVNITNNFSWSIWDYG